MSAGALILAGGAGGQALRASELEGDDPSGLGRLPRHARGHPDRGEGDPVADARATRRSSRSTHTATSTRSCATSTATASSGRRTRSSTASPTGCCRRGTRCSRSNLALVAVTADLRDELLRLIPDERRVSDGESVLDQHAGDLSYHPPHRPDVVVFPESTAEVTAVLAYADAAGVPVVPFGAGTSLEGHVIPLHGGISLDLTRMNAIVALYADDLTVTVQPGVTRSQLEAAAGPHGLFFPVDPGADATLGGMAATNASGTTTVRYGGMRAHVLALEVVLAGGRVVRTGTRAVKTSAGYNLTGPLHRLGGDARRDHRADAAACIRSPSTSSSRAPRFPSVEAACRAAAAIIGSGVLVTRCELLDATTIAALNALQRHDAFRSRRISSSSSAAPRPPSPAISRRRARSREDEGASAFESRERPDRARADVGRAPQRAAWRRSRSRPARSAMTTDVAVPVSAAGGRDRARAARARRVRPTRRHRRPRRRRQLPRRVPARPRRRGVDRAGRGAERARSSRTRSRAAARAPASTASATASSPTSSSEHGDLLPLMRGIKQLLRPERDHESREGCPSEGTRGPALSARASALTTAAPSSAAEPRGPVDAGTSGCPTRT